MLKKIQTAYLGLFIIIIWDTKALKATKRQYLKTLEKNREKYQQIIFANISIAKNLQKSKTSLVVLVIKTST